MATDRTRTVRARVPVEVMEGLERDANDFNTSVGSLIRSILEARYCVPTDIEKSVRRVRKTDIQWSIPNGE